MFPDLDQYDFGKVENPRLRARSERARNPPPSSRALCPGPIVQQMLALQGSGAMRTVTNSTAPPVEQWVPGYKARDDGCGHFAASRNDSVEPSVRITTPPDRRGIERSDFLRCILNGPAALQNSAWSLAV